MVSALTDRSRLGGGAKAAAALPVPPEAAAAAAAAVGLPPWLVHWRLRATLSSQQLFIELFCELSEAAAKCYSQCGHQRSAALLRADVADALAAADQMQRAAELYQRQCDNFLREGWHALAAHALPKLAACQLAVGSSGLAHTAASLLSLPTPFRGSAAEREAACQLLLQAAQQPDGGSARGSGSSRASTAGSPSAAVPGAAAIDLSAAILATPAKHSFSRFFGRVGTGGEPLMFPPPGQPNGAYAAAVGDALAISIAVHSQLPLALRLQDVTLALGVLQEMTGEAFTHPTLLPAVHALSTHPERFTITAAADPLCSDPLATRRQLTRGKPG